MAFVSNKTLEAFDFNMGLIHLHLKLTKGMDNLNIKRPLPNY